jgi:hypothetical protein
VITQYTTTNEKKYNELFAKASEALGVEMIYVPVTIGSQAEFMQSIIDGCVYYTKSGEEYVVVEAGAEFSAETQYYMASSGIQTLEQYFCHLGSLLDQHNGYKYIMLPLDEAPLEINANTREITVPAVFKTAGLSV